MRRWAILGTAVILAVTVAACGSPPFIDLPNPVSGQVSGIQADSMELTTGDGHRYAFRMDDPTQLGLGDTLVDAIRHLGEHQANRQAVSVTWRRDGYELVAVTIADG